MLKFQFITNKQKTGENTMKKKVILSAVWLLLIAADASAGWVFTESSEGDKQITYIQDNKMKFAAADQMIIFDLDNNLISFGNPKEKSYWSGPPDEFAAQTRKSVEIADRVVERQLSKVPAGQREVFKQNIDREVNKQINARPPAVEVKESNRTSVMKGYNVRKYEILFNGMLRQEQWIAEDIRVDKEFDVKRFGKMLTAFYAGLGQGNDDVVLSSPQVTNLLTKGWPLKKTDYDEDGYPESDEVIKVENISLPSSTFEVPASWRKLSLSDIFGK